MTRPYPGRAPALACDECRRVLALRALHAVVTDALLCVGCLSRRADLHDKPQLVSRSQAWTLLPDPWRHRVHV